MLTHCLDGHERLWKNRMIGASKLMKLTAFKWNKLQSLSQICEAARGDPVLSHAMRCILYYYGWPAEKCIPDELKIYYNKQDVFTVEDGCILRGIWIWPTRPWQRIHVDFAGPFNGQMFLLVVDEKSSGLKYFQCPQPLHQRPSERYVSCLPPMVYQRSLSQIMVLSSFFKK